MLVASSLVIPAATLANTPVSGAAFTTTNTDVDGTGNCKNGNEAVNCNIYLGKEFVWLSGGPVAAALSDGDYFFAVLDPGGQNDPNDGSDDNLSDVSPTSGTGAGDAYADREFAITGGVISYGGPHDYDSNKIRLMGYDDTTNNGGVYILAICNLADGYPVDPSDCKYDAFKVNNGQTQADPLTIDKNASGAYDDPFVWTIGKAVDKTRVTQNGGTATFNYTVTVSHDAGTVGNITVSGTITVFNPNFGDVTGVDVTDQLSDGTICTVTGGSAATVTSGDNDFDYSCSLAALPAGPITNTATATWSAQSIDDGSLAAGSPSATVPVSFTADLIDECVDVTDSFNGANPPTALGTVCVGDPNPKSFTYSHTVNVPASDCVSYSNTATFTTNDTATTGSASQTVTVCGPVRTGALTMGFWQNKNGQGIIKAQAATGVCPSATWLRGYAPFQDLAATSTCAQTATYVYNVIKAATCTSSSKTCNSMLKAQMLATALDVYFSDPALGGNRIGAPAPIGGVNIDLTKICSMIDGSGGTATCSGSYKNVSSAFGGANALTVSQMLTYAASQSNVGGSTWYGQVKATQVLAKDAFDAINNQVAFAAP
jgi:hypothetical protein